MTGKLRQASNTTTMHFKSSTKQVSEVFQSLRIDTNNVHSVEQQAQPLQQQPPLQQPVEQQQTLEPLQKESQGELNSKNYASKFDALPNDEEQLPFARSIHRIIKDIRYHSVYTPPKHSPRRKLEPESLLPTPANSPCYSSHNSTMFWFSNEEPEHAQSIFSFYVKILKIDKSSIKFIGRIKRMCMTNECIENIRNASLTTEHLGQLDELYTLDELSIFHRHLLPYGSSIPFDTKKHCITSWSLDGLPQTIDLIEDMEKVKALLGKSSYANHCQVVSYLFCLPIFNSNEFTYFSSCYDQQVTFSDKQCCCLANSQGKKKQLEEQDQLIQVGQEEDYDSCPLLMNSDKDAVSKEEAATITITTEDYMIGLLSPVSPLGFNADLFENMDAESEQTSDNDEIEEEEEEQEELEDQQKRKREELNMEYESIDRSDADTEQTSDEGEMEGEFDISDEEEDEEEEEEYDEEDGENDEESGDEEEDDEDDDSISFRKKWRR